MKIEDHEQHWNDDLNAARGVFGWPLIISWVLIALIAAGASYLF